MFHPYFRWVALAAVLLLSSVAAQAQGCAMCYASAAAQSEQGIHALNLGILVLLIPTLAIFGGIFWMAYRHRNSWEAPPRRQSGLLRVALPRRPET